MPGRKRGQKDVDTEQGGQLEVDFAYMAVSRILTYVVEWSFENDKGKRMSINRQQIEALRSPLVDHLNDMINEHEEAIAEEKKAQTGSSKPKTKSA